MCTKKKGLVGRMLSPDFSVSSTSYSPGQMATMARKAPAKGNQKLDAKRGKLSDSHGGSSYQLRKQEQVKAGEDFEREVNELEARERKVA